MISLKNSKGQHSLHRVIPYYGSIILTIGFIKEAWSRNLTWLDYVGYAVGLTVLYCPVAAVKLINALRPAVPPAAATDPPPPEEGT